MNLYTPSNVFDVFLTPEIVSSTSPNMIIGITITALLQYVSIKIIIFGAAVLIYVWEILKTFFNRK